MSTTTMPPVPPRTVPTRRISFEETFADLPKHFAGEGDLVMSHVIACLSAVFPDGEDFFVRSVRHFRSEVTDPELARQVSGFIGQEAVHGREHRALNDRLDALGYPTKRIERMTKWALAKRTEIMPPKANLAATAALEHFTATLAEIVLSDDEARRRLGDPAITDLLVWHALEESEHKSVAFDVYKAVGGSERTRTLTMNVICVGFIGGMTLEAVLSLARDPATFRRGELRRSLRRLRGSPFLRREVWRTLRDFNRADFHPDDYDNAELTEQWRQALFGADGSLNELLVARPTVAA